jgi:thermitase
VNHLLLLLSLFFIIIHLPQAVFAQSSESSDSIIVKFKPNTTFPRKQEIFNELQSIDRKEIKQLSTDVLKVPRGKASLLLNRLKNNPDIEYAEEDFKAFKVDIPNDSLFSQQWGLTKIQSAEAWSSTVGSANVDVAILDSGISTTHLDLIGKVSKRANFTNVADIDLDGHGTHVAGIVAPLTNNEIGVAGIGRDTSLFSVKVLDNNGSGYYSWIANGITWAADNGAEVINLSLGGSSSSITLKNAIDYAWNKGVIIAAAAGNNGRNTTFYPAYYTNTIAVAATTQTDTKASFSNYGNWVDLAAPGQGILSTVINGGYESWSGTSMATPFVSGLAALVKAKNPSWTNLQIRDRLESSADKISGTGTYWSKGRINACKALDCVASVSATPIPSSTPSSTPTMTPSPTQTPQPTTTPLPIVTASPSPVATIAPSPTPAPKPWWCVYIPTHYLCQ